MADPAPIWVTLTVPVITAVAGYLVPKLDLIAFNKTKQYAGTWYAYYRDPDGAHEIQEEIWYFSKLGRVTVTRSGKATFKGRLEVGQSKAFMRVESTLSSNDRLFVLLHPPHNPRLGDAVPSVCLWLGEDLNSRATAGHAMLSRAPIKGPAIADEFIRA